MIWKNRFELLEYAASRLALLLDVSKIFRPCKCSIDEIDSKSGVLDDECSITEVHRQIELVVLMFR